MPVFIWGLLKTALLAKAWQFLKRQMAKPENQARAKELVNRATSSSSGRTAPPRPRGRRLIGRRATA